MYNRIKNKIILKKMKRNLMIFVLLLIIGAKCLYSQGSQLTIFHQEGERFWVIIDGIKQNDKPQASVFLENLMPEYLRLKIIFENEKIKDINQTVATKDMESNFTHSKYIIRPGKKGKVVMRLHSYEALSSIPPKVEVAVPEIKNETPVIANPTAVSANSPIPGVNININIPQINQVVSEQLETITQIPVNQNRTTDQTQNLENDIQKPKVSNCQQAMNQNDFLNAKKTIESQSFEETKLTIANQILMSNCLMSSQVKEIIELFNFESSRLDFAKAAYSKVFDSNNYYILNESFKFQSSISELSKYISTIQK